MTTTYGPHIEEVERFLGKLRGLSLEQLGEVIRAWRGALAESGVWHRAEDAVSIAITRTGRHRGQSAVIERLFNLFRDAPWFKDHQPGSLIAGSDAAAQYVATIASLALLVRDALSTADFEMLYLPFQGLIPAEGLVSVPSNTGRAPTAHLPSDSSPRPTDDRSRERE